jgi:flagellar L-ring protein precursor FlgH
MNRLKEEKPMMIESAASVFLENPPTNLRLSRLAGTIATLTLLLVLAACPTYALGLPGKKKPDAAADKSKATPPEEALKAYIQRVRTQHETEVRTPGSIWIDQGRLVRLSTDAKAVRLHDVVAIVVAESVAAETDGQVKNSRASNASSGFTGLFGNLSAGNRLQNLIGQNSASGLNAQGQSVTNSSLTTTFGAEVVDVLPNGMLVVQATRQLTFSQQTQLIKLRGLVRPEDVSAQNQVLSTAMTDLELEVTGKGIINDTTYRQNPVWRFLQRLLIF